MGAIEVGRTSYVEIQWLNKVKCNKHMINNELVTTSLTGTSVCRQRER